MYVDVCTYLHESVWARLQATSVRLADTHTVAVVGNEFANFCKLSILILSFENEIIQ